MNGYCKTCTMSVDGKCICDDQNDCPRFQVWLREDVDQNGLDSVDCGEAATFPGYDC